MMLHRAFVIGVSRMFSSFNIVNLVKNCHYTCENHEVITEDGYILTLHRLIPPASERSVSGGLNGIPILLQHGLWSSSEDWILSGPSKSIGYLLAEASFDVWLGNSRGNQYSRGHVKYSPSKNTKDYWNFSWHEMGYFDLPAAIDYILKSTSHRYLYYIGHSQGTTSFFVLASMRPEYSSKIKAMFALAPVVYLSHMRNDRLLNLALYQEPLFVFFTCIGNYKFVPDKKILSLLNSVWTKNIDKYAPRILKKLSSYATPEVKKNLKDILMSHVSCGTSFKQLAHFAQCTLPGKKFRQFDYGPTKNVEVYGKTEAPVYDLKKITIPIVLFHSDGDWLTQPEDVNTLIEELASDVEVVKVQFSKFNHLDFLWADFKEYLLYDTLIQYILKYEDL